jgi:hypothetical protein
MIIDVQPAGLDFRTSHGTCRYAGTLAALFAPLA